MNFRDKVVWTAGFVEGEGHFQRPQRGKCAFKLSIAQKDEQFLSMLKEWWGGIVSGSGKEYIPSWGVTGPTAAGLCMMMFPFLSYRTTEQLRVALEGWLKQSIHPSQMGTCPRGHRLTPYPYKGRPKRWCHECRKKDARDYQRRKRIKDR